MQRNQQVQIDELKKMIIDLFKLNESRSRDIIGRLQKLHNDQIELKIFLKTRLGAPDASRLKDIMKQRLDRERFSYN